MNKLALFGILATGIVAGAVVAVNSGGHDGEEPERALKGSLGGLAVVGIGAWGVNRWRKHRKRTILPAS